MLGAHQEKKHSVLIARGRIKAEFSFGVILQFCSWSLELEGLQWGAGVLLPTTVCLVFSSHWPVSVAPVVCSPWLCPVGHEACVPKV